MLVTSPRSIAVALLCCAPIAATGNGPPRHDSGLERLAAGLAGEVRAAARDAGHAPEGLDVALVVRGRSPRLCDDVAALARTRLESAGFRSARKVEAIDVAAARRAGIDLAVEVEVTLGRDGARLDGMVSALGPAPWRDQPSALAHLHLEAPLDGELRVYLPAAELDPPSKRPTTGPMRSHGAPVGDVAILALDVGDADGDGRNEVVAVTADEVVVWRYDAPSLRFIELRRVRFAGARAAVRPRLDVGTVSVEKGEIRARSSRFSDGARIHLDAKGERVEALAGYPLPGLPVTCALEPGVDWFRAAGCSPSLPLPERFWSATGMRGGHAFHAAVDPQRTLWLFAPPTVNGETRAIAVRGAGAQVALAALERGEVVVTGDAVEPGAPDALVVRSLAALLPRVATGVEAAGAPVLQRIDRLPGAVAALAAGDVDGDGQVEIVAALRDRAGRTEIWIVY